MPSSQIPSNSDNGRSLDFGNNVPRFYTVSSSRYRRAQICRPQQGQNRARKLIIRMWRKSTLSITNAWAVDSSAMRSTVPLTLSPTIFTSLCISLKARILFFLDSWLAYECTPNSRERTDLRVHVFGDNLAASLRVPGEINLPSGGPLAARGFVTCDLLLETAGGWVLLESRRTITDEAKEGHIERKKADYPPLWNTRRPRMRYYLWLRVFEFLNGALATCALPWCLDNFRDALAIPSAVRNMT